MQTPQEFEKILNGFIGLSLPFAPNFKDPVVFNVWYAELKCYSRDDFVKMYKYVRAKKWERFPQMAEWLEGLHGEIESLTAQAWTRVLKLMSNTYKPIPIDEITARALKEILPHSNIHNLTDSWTEENLQWRKKEFAEAFRTSYDMSMRGTFDHEDLPKLSAARDEVPVFKVSKEALRSSNFLEGPPEKAALPPLSAEEVMTLVRQHRVEKLIVEPTERVIEPVQKRRSSGLKEHLQAILKQ